MALALTTVGVVRNLRSHANRGQSSGAPSGLHWAEPETPQALVQDMKRFADAGVDLLVIDGGDGTVREVLSALPAAYGDRPPVLAVLASGKTNVLALDLGAGRGWTLAEVLRRAATDAPSLKSRAPLEVSWTDQPPVRGFILGLGAFARATQMSKAVHRMGAYHSLSVALTLAGAALGTLFDNKASPWRRGIEATVAVDGAAQPVGQRFVLIVTALKRLPFGLKPFGPPREGMKVLDVEAPPRGLLSALPVVLAGRGDGWLAARGYRRALADRLDLRVDEPIVIDGEVFPGGAISVRLGAPLRFLVP
ncbi:diacylglycerol kinase family protein [Phenylobacterium sp.]|uniref:diacylglycerol/lipid kinase family protein n=1 Tax=Phenylobacterium sp. TaxID=1871053 RepID=UPI0027379A68|nr:diacylglycerol kinase family protein [Phenylobacterium sp.]MDP3869353.1 diacylglycerol kinase family protein [Phenylobacterium sp.]